MNADQANLSINISDLISIKAFSDELGMHQNAFTTYHRRKQIEGLIRVAGRFVVNRKTIDILPLKEGCERFRIWKEIGGREGAVDVGAELIKRKRYLSRNWTHFMKGKYDQLPDFFKQKRIGVSGNT